MKIKTKLPPTKVKRWAIANTSGKGIDNPPYTIHVTGVYKGRKTVRPQETIDYTVRHGKWIATRRRPVIFINGVFATKDTPLAHALLNHPRCKR